MKFILNTSAENIVLPKSPLLEKLGQVSETELKVLLCAAALSAESGSFDENDIKNISDIDLNDIIFALQFWRGAGLLSAAAKNTAQAIKADVQPTEKKQTLKNNDTPTYSGEEIACLFEKNSEIKMLIEECQKIAGKMFNPLEINKIVSLYDYLGLSSEYILLLYNYCKGKNKTTVHYVEKTAFNLYDEGVDTDEKLQEYIRYKERFDSVAGKVRRIFGTSDRAMSKKEEQFIKKWTEDWAFSLELIKYAFEITVDSTAKASMPYANKVLENWHNNGITTVEGAKELNSDFKKPTKTENTNPSNSSFDDDEFFEAALKRSYENIGKKPD